MTPDWITRWSGQGYDLDWHPVAVAVGLLHHSTGVRFAMVMDDKIGLLVPDVDRELVSRAEAMVAERERGQR